MLRVAVGILFDEQGRVLINRRHDDGSDVAGYWEFPGGKLEDCEEVEDCLYREFREEFAIEVEPVELLLAKVHDYGNFEVDLEFWRCQLVGGEVDPLEGHEWCWCPINELGKYKFLAANQAVLEILVDM